MEKNKFDFIPEVIQASEGKIFRRIQDGQLFGDIVYLGYMYYINNEKLNEPIMATPEMFEEVDKPENEEDIFEGEVKDGGNE